MDDRIIKLVTPDDLGVSASEEKVYDFVTIIREEYTDELMAYFLRSKTGALLFVNSAYSAKVQAKAISMIVREIEKCRTVEAGVLKKGFKYVCGGSRCEYCYKSGVI